MIRTSLFLVALLLSGCANTDMVQFENRIVCTVDGTEAHFLNKWWLFSFGSRIAASDAAVVCKGE